MSATNHQGNRPTKHQEEHEMTTTMETARAELMMERAALHALIENASLPALRVAFATTRAAVLVFDTPDGVATLRREHDAALAAAPPDDEDPDDDADGDAAPASQ